MAIGLPEAPRLDPVPGVRGSAHATLVRFTMQDFTQRVEDWRGWWNENRSRHRIEWLIDGLVHHSTALRTAASRELEGLTGLSFGYRAELPFVMGHEPSGIVERVG